MANTYGRQESMKVRRACAALTACVTLLLCNLAAAQPKAPGALLEFNYGIPNANHASVFVAQDLGLFEKVGLKPNFYIFQSGAPLLAGLKSESLDVVTAGLALAFAIGQNIPLKFIFWEANSAVSEGLVVDPKSGIKSYHDIVKAKKIGAASGTCAQVAATAASPHPGIHRPVVSEGVCGFIARKVAFLASTTKTLHWHVRARRAA